MKKVWTSLLLILSAAFLLTACADGGQQDEDTGAEGGLPGELAQIPRDYFDETTYLGTPENPSAFKNVLDNAMAGGDMEPMIVVCPTYNNTSSSDSDNYGLALELTDNYHSELINDLIPAVEGTYSTYADDTSPEGLAASRDHRAFCGFSMGSVTTWHTFEYCLDYFRYFMPSSGSLTTDGDYMASIVRESGHDWDDFFIFAASGTEDFAYSSFRRQIQAMEDVEDVFRTADNEAEGNLWFLVQEDGTHSGEYALQYFYNGVIGLLTGSTATGFLMAIFMANAGGAWDNAKKYIESGKHGGKGSEQHKAAVVGDTVGDPFKDTSGPSINILIKLLSMVSIVFAALVVNYHIF